MRPPGRAGVFDFQCGVWHSSRDRPRTAADDGRMPGIMTTVELIAERRIGCCWLCRAQLVFMLSPFAKRLNQY